MARREGKGRPIGGTLRPQGEFVKRRGRKARKKRDREWDRVKFMRTPKGRPRTAPGERRQATDEELEALRERLREKHRRLR